MPSILVSLMGGKKGGKTETNKQYKPSSSGVIVSAGASGDLSENTNTIQQYRTKINKHYNYVTKIYRNNEQNNSNMVFIYNYAMCFPHNLHCHVHSHHNCDSYFYPVYHM